jgi:TonB-linked SusC/RagA family outer membrane protein
MKNIYYYKSMTNSKLLVFFVTVVLFMLSDFAKLKAENSASDGRVVSGIVLDNQDEPLIGVTIKVLGVNRGTTTGSDGSFTLSVQPGDSEILVSYVGYKAQNIQLGNQRTFRIVLEENVTVMDEVLVIGYGTQSRHTLTSTISKLDTKVLENIPYTNISQALQGNIPGLRVQTTTGQPGSPSRIVLRGGTSITNPNGSAPLYIVDGIIKTNLNDINADNIESIDVLKDAASTAIYGARGSNGVILVTTKGGDSSGSSTVNYRFSLSTSELWKRYEMANAQEYIYFNRIGATLTGQKRPAHLNFLTGPNGFGIGNDLSNNTAYNVMYLDDTNKHKLDEKGWYTMSDPLDPSKTILYTDIDWQDILFRTGVSQNHFLSFSGGTKKANMFASLGYMLTEGVAITTQYERLTADLGGNLQIFPTVGVDAKINFSYNKSHDVFGNNELFQRALALPPTTKFRFEDGTLAPGQNRSIGNPVYHLERRKIHKSNNKLSISFGGYWNILPGLKFEPRASLYVDNDLVNFFQASYWNGPTNLVDSRGANAKYMLKWQRQFDAVLSYIKSFDDTHNIQASAGSSYFNVINYELEAVGNKAATDNIPTLNAATPVRITSSADNHIINGYFGRFTYDFKRRYLLTATIRADGASNLGYNNKWGYFPGVSAGWNIQNETFWENVKPVVSTLKPRISYGVNGNIGGITPYHAQGEYSLTNTYNGKPTAIITRMKNDDMKWEESRTTNVGLDLGFVNNRFNLLLDVYNRQTNNLLTSYFLPKETGFNSVLTNYGSLENKGVELAISTIIIQAKKRNDLALNLDFNIAHNSNKILKLPNNGNERNRVGGIYVFDRNIGDYIWAGGQQEGGKLGDLFAYKQLGIYKTDEEALSAPLDQIADVVDKTKYGGDVIWDDLDENGIIDERDRVKVGNIYPDFTGGINADLHWAGVSLNIRTDFAVGHTIYHESRARFLGQFQGDINTIKEVNNSWQNPGDVTDIPRYWFADQDAQNNLFRGNSHFYEKGDYLAIREVTLQYELPKSWIQKTPLNSALVSVTGANLTYLTNYKGLAPEDGGTDNGRYPLSRTFTFNLNIKF